MDHPERGVAPGEWPLRATDPGYGRKVRAGRRRASRDSRAPGLVGPLRPSADDGAAGYRFEERTVQLLLAGSSPSTSTFQCRATAPEQPLGSPSPTPGPRPVAVVRFSTEQTVNESSRKLHRRLAGTFGTDTRPSPESRWRRSAALIAINATAVSSVHDHERYRRAPPCAPSRLPLLCSCLLAVRIRRRLLIRP